MIGIFVQIGPHQFCQDAAGLSRFYISQQTSPPAL